MRNLRSIALAATLGAVLLTGCSSGRPVAAPANTGEPSVSSSPTGSSSRQTPTPSPVRTPCPAGPTDAQDGSMPTATLPTFPTTSAAALGSEPLKTGQFFGFASAADLAGRTVTFDVAQWFSGDAAKQASTADGNGSDVPNDYYIRNVNTFKRVVPVGCAAVVTVARCPEACGTYAGTWAGFATALNTLKAMPDLKAPYRGSFGSYWLTVQDGMVVRIDEQYRP